MYGIPLLVVMQSTYVRRACFESFMAYGLGKVLANILHIPNTGEA